MGKKVNVVRPDGSVSNVDEAQAERLVRVFGYKVEEQEEAVERIGEKIKDEYYDSTGQKILTGLEGIASGATVGLADPLMADYSTSQRAARNPGYRIGGELTGAILPALLTAGGSAPESAALSGARIAARLTPSGALSRVVGTSARGLAAEGAVVGAGSALTEASLTGDPLTAESVLAHAGVGALIGFGTGAAGEYLVGLGKTKRGLVDDIVPSSATPGDDTLEKFYASLPDQKAKRAIGLPKAEPDSFVQSYRAEVTDVKASGKLVDDTVYNNFRRGLDDATLGLNVAETDVSGALKTAQGQLKEYNRSLKSAAGDLRAAISVTKREAADLATDAAEKKVIQSEFIDLEDTYKATIKALEEDNPLKALNRLERFKTKIKENAHFRGASGAALPSLPDSKVALKIRDTIKAAEDTVRLKATSTALKDFPKTQEEFFAMKGPRAEKLFAALDNAPSDLQSSFSGLDEIAENLGVSLSGSAGTKARGLWELGKSNKAYTATTREVNRTRFELPNVSSAEPAAPRVAGGATPLPTKQQWPEIKEFLPEFVSTTNTARGSSNYARSGFWGKVARLGGARQASHMSRAAGMGAFGSALAYEAGAGVVGSLLAGVAGAKANIVGRIASAATKYAPTVGRGLKRVGPRVEPLAVRIDGTLDGDYKQGDKRELFKKRSEDILNIGPGFNNAAYMAVEPVLGNHPEFAKSVMDSAITAFNALTTFLPKDPGLAFSRLKTLWRPSDLQIAQFEKAYEVYHNPVGVIDQVLLSGNVDVITMTALREMYPSLYGELQYKMLARLQEPEFMASLNYGEQARLSIMLDIPIHSNFTPRSIAHTQSMYQSLRRPEPMQNGSGASGGGRPAKSEAPTAGQSLVGR